jgi:hypothetical protein
MPTRNELLEELDVREKELVRLSREFSLIVLHRLQQAFPELSYNEAWAWALQHPKMKKLEELQDQVAKQTSEIATRTIRDLGYLEVAPGKFAIGHRMNHPEAPARFADVPAGVIVEPSSNVEDSGISDD